MAVTANTAKTVAVYSPGHLPTKQEVQMMAGVDVGIASGEGGVVAGVPVKTDAFVEARVFEIVKQKRRRKSRPDVSAYA